MLKVTVEQKADKLKTTTTTRVHTETKNKKHNRKSTVETTGPCIFPIVLKAIIGY